MPRRWLAARLGLLGAVRSPLRPVATAAFLAAATGIVAFAGSYQATLAPGRGRPGRPSPSRSTPPSAAGQNLRPPLDVAGLAGYTAAGAAVHEWCGPPATVRLNASQAITPEMVGVDPAALALIPSWSTVVGGGDPAAVAA